MLPPFETSLQERDEALAVGDRLLAEVGAGLGRVLVLEGPAGIGKTRVLETIRERARAAGLQVLRARAGELERDFSYGVVRQLFETQLAGPSRAELLSGAAELARPVFDVTQTGEQRAGDPAQGTLHGLYWLTVNCVEAGPLLISLDDLHWCDPASVRFLAYLVRRLDGLGVLLLTTMRPRSGPEPGVIDEVTDSPSTTLLQLQPLSPAGVASLLSAHFGAEADPQFSSTVSEWTAGNPLLLRELIAAAAVRRIDPTAAGAMQIRELAPESVGRLVLRRIAPLGPRALALAQAVAVLGEDAQLAQAFELAGLSRQDASRAYDALQGIDVLSRGERLAFVHPLVRRAIYDDMESHRREAAHAAAAELLAAAGTASSRVATHLLAVAPRGAHAVVASLRAAAREAMAQGAPDAAATYLSRALAEPPADAERTALRVELGLALARARPAECVPYLMEVIETTDDDLLAEAVVALSYVPLTSLAVGQYDEWVPIALRAIDRIRDKRAVRRVEAHYVIVGGFRPDHYPAAKQLLDAITVDDDGDDEPVSQMLLGLKASHAAREGARPEVALELARSALTGEALIRGNSAAFGLPCNVLIHLDQFDEVVTTLNRVLAHARRTGFLSTFTMASWLKAWVRFGRGDLAGAEAELPIAIDPDPTRLRGMRLGDDVLGQVALHRGDLPVAAEHLDYSDEVEEPGVWGWAISRGRRGVLRAGQGRLDAAVDDLLTAGSWLTALGCANPAYFPWRSEAALVLGRLERRDEGLALAREEVELARVWGAPRALGNALCSAGLVTGGDDGLDLFREATSVLRDSPAALTRARAETELGAALRRANRRADARAPLALGLELAERCGATSTVERAREELIATGARPRRVARTGVDSLTASERRVARMAAEGLTNRDVAQALFVTPKTIEVHLSHAYQKLGIKSRSQLQAALLQAG